MNNIPNSPFDISWQLFALTGNPAYYMLHSRLSEDDDEMTQEDLERR